MEEEEGNGEGQEHMSVVKRLPVFSCYPGWFGSPMDVWLVVGELTQIEQFCPLLK